MRAGRISIAGLVTLIAVVAVWLAALKVASDLWLGITSTVSLGLVLTAVLGTVFRKGKARGFWAGFTLFGVVYLVLVHWGYGVAMTASDLTGGFRNFDLMTGLQELALWVHPQPPSPSGGGMGMGGFLSRSPAQMAQSRHEQVVRNFESICRYGLCLAFALAGGLVGRAFAAEGAGNRGAGSDDSSTHGR